MKPLTKTQLKNHLKEYINWHELSNDHHNHVVIIPHTAVCGVRFSMCSINLVKSYSSPSIIYQIWNKSKELRTTIKHLIGVTNIPEDDYKIFRLEYISSVTMGPWIAASRSISGTITGLEKSVDGDLYYRYDEENDTVTFDEIPTHKINNSNNYDTIFMFHR
jgi:hypothetical protein